MNKKPLNLASYVAEQNRRVPGDRQSLTGTVTFVADLRAQAAVAFRLKHGGTETLFWISTARQESDHHYRCPLPGETVKVWFNDKAGTLAVPGESAPARGVCEINNISGDAERDAFAWFREHGDNLPFKP